MSDVHVWLNRENEITRLVVDGEEISREVRCKIVFNYWIRDVISIHQASGYIAKFEAYFQIVMAPSRQP